MPQAAAIWDQRYSRNPEEVDRIIQYEPWLNRWQPVIAGCPVRALDLGCGPGYDTEVLLKWGCKVMAVDLSSAAIALSQARNPKATHWVMDVRSLRGFPGTFDLVIASLSLHYFNRKETESIFNSINGLLKPGGYFAFRVNAFDDVESGAPANGSLYPLPGLLNSFSPTKKSLMCLMITSGFYHGRNLSLIDMATKNRCSK